MDKREQDILTQLDEKTKNIEVPDSLRPDAVKKTLEENSRKAGKWRLSRAACLAAACLVLAAGVSAAVLRYGGCGDRVQTGKTSPAASGGKIASAKDYDQVYSYIENYNKQMDREEAEFKIEESSEISSEDASFQSARNAGAEADKADAGTREAEYSSTNVRQEGVDEADTVKTDGKYLYVLKDSRQEVAIVEAKEGSLKEYGNIQAEEGTRIEEFYLNPEKKKLVMVCSSTGDSGDSLLRDMNYNGAAEAVTYDVSNPSKPVETGRIKQSGTYSSSRMSGDYVYLFSTYYAGAGIARDDEKSFVPLVNGRPLASDAIYLPQTDMANMYEVVTSLDIEDPDTITDSKAIFSKGGEIYVSNENIYYYENEWEGSGRTNTTVRRIAYKDGRLKAEAQGTFDGYLNDSFSIDEYKGYLRVAVTAGDTNAVYILDDKLKITGSIEGLAKDERIYSARFMGDTGYFVTFRETDPLYSVDLSDPEKPEIKGALKIPGFSDYLHFYGENLLIGIGMDVDEKTSVTGGVKLTMFDISDMTDVKEKDTYVLDNVYGTDVSYDHRAALIDAGKNMIGFPGYEAGGQKYFLFSYDSREGFKCLLDEEINGSGMMAARGIYIGDVLYIVQGNVVESYSLGDYSKIDDIIL